MSDSAFEWSVGKLQELNFDGDADALAAYVNALIENNRDAEGADPELLRSRARQELEDFLGAPDAATFVDGLMRHLASNVQHGPVPPASAISVPSGASVSADAPREGKGHEHQAVTEEASSRPDPSAHSEAKQPLSEPTVALSKRSASGLSQAKNDRSGSSGGNNGMEPGDPHAVRDLRSSRNSLSRTPISHDVQGIHAALTEAQSSAGLGHGDLRSQLSRSRVPPAKRPRDGEVQDGVGGGRDRPSDGSWGRGRERDRGQGPRDQDGIQRAQERELVHPTDPAEQPSKHARRTGPGPSNGTNNRTPVRDAGLRGVDMRSGPGGFPGNNGRQIVPAVGYLPPPPPGFLQHMRDMIHQNGPPPHGFPPHVPGMMPPPVVVPPGGISPFMHAGHASGSTMAARGRGRGGTQGGVGRQPQQTAHQQRGRALANVLILRNVPHEKLTLGAINEYFQKFGTVSNIQLRPAHQPDHAFIEFAHRAQAQAAYDCVDAVMGNRHVRLYWARESDFEQDGLPLTGVELAPVGPNRKQAFHPGLDPNAQNMTAAPSREPDEDPAVVLQRKRKEIAAAREEQLKIKAERQTDYDKCIAEQKSLFAKLEAGCSEAEKKELLKRVKALRKEAETILATIKPKETNAKQGDTTEISKTAPHLPSARGSNRGRGPMSADFRPKIVRITGSSSEGLSEDLAKSIFHETTSAKFVEGEWVLDFASRRAAESATKALGVLKKRFGINAVMRLADSRSPTLPTVGISEPDPQHPSDTGIDTEATVMDGDKEANDVTAIENGSIAGSHEQSAAFTMAATASGTAE
jgi:hypothetical protein